jgi:hypothetical protein
VCEACSVYGQKQWKTRREGGGREECLTVGQLASLSYICVRDHSITLRHIIVLTFNVSFSCFYFHLRISHGFEPGYPPSPDIRGEESQGLLTYNGHEGRGRPQMGNHQDLVQEYNSLQ